MKRILLFIAVAVVLVGIGVALYFFFFAPKATLTTGTPSFFPDSGDSSNTGVQGAQDVGVPVSGAGTDVAPRLIRISDKPVAYGTSVVFVPGVAVGSTTSTSTPQYSTNPDVSISYIERESGNVYAFMASARTLTRVSNKTLPGIYDAVWAPDGSTAFVRFIQRSGTDETIRSFALPRTGQGGYSLEAGISQMLVTGSSTLVTITPVAGGTIATASTIAGTNAKTLFTSILSRIKASIGGTTTVITTRASQVLDGYAFTIQKDGTPQRVLGPLTGLTTLVSPSGGYILYSFVSGKKTTLAVYDIQTKTATQLPVSTFTEKCTWSSDSLSLYCAVPTSLSGTLPDDWYQGVLHTTDRLWRINLSDRVASQIVDLETVGAGKIDAVSLAVDRTQSDLVFTDRVTGALYLYQLQ